MVADDKLSNQITFTWPTSSTQMRKASSHCTIAELNWADLITPFTKLIIYNQDI